MCYIQVNRYAICTLILFKATLSMPASDRAVFALACVSYCWCRVNDMKKSRLLTEKLHQQKMWSRICYHKVSRNASSLLKGETICSAKGFHDTICMAIYSHIKSSLSGALADASNIMRQHFPWCFSSIKRCGCTQHGHSMAHWRQVMLVAKHWFVARCHAGFVHSFTALMMSAA